MKTRRLVLPVTICMLAVASFLFFLRRSPQNQDSWNKSPLTTDSQKVAGRVSPSPNEKNNKFPADDRPEVQTLYRFAEAANLYNFDPKITYFVTNESSSLIDLGTPTHGASTFGRGNLRGKLHKVHSYFDGSDDRRKPEVADLWYQCTGTWTEVEAVAQVYEILRKMGENELLERLQTVNKHEFRNYEYSVQTPEGKIVKVTPFPTIVLYDKFGSKRVIAEFRMGTNGPVGLTRWFCLY